MNLGVIIQSEVNQTKTILYDATNTWNLKYDTNEVIHETERDSQTQRIDLWLPNRGVWID